VIHDTPRGGDDLHQVRDGAGGARVHVRVEVGEVEFPRGEAAFVGEDGEAGAA
jgi:hypothetical protein